VAEQLTTFEHRDAAKEYGSVVQNVAQNVDGNHLRRAVFVLMRCAGCGRGGIAKIADNGAVIQGILADFYPKSIDNARLPEGTPRELVAEFREAELSSSVGANRAASALFRSVLEKALKSNVLFQRFSRRQN
jgi:hypothetical protein